MHGEVVGSGAVGGSSTGGAVAEAGISAMGGADIPVPGDGISLRCG